jgi:hypothetical protein
MYVCQPIQELLHHTLQLSGVELQGLHQLREIVLYVLKNQECRVSLSYDASVGNTVPLGDHLQ